MDALEEYVKEHPDEFLREIASHFGCGKDAVHKTNTTRSIIKQVGCKLLFLPPYSPDLNPIEHLWANAKRKLSNILPDSPSIQDALCACFL